MESVLIQIFEALQYSFIQKAMISGVFIALSCSFLGVFLVLRKLSMIGDGLAHVSFATIALSIFLSTSPIFLSIPIVVTASFFILKLNEKTSMYGDAAIGLVSSFSVAIGVLIASVSNGFNIDLFSYLFGSILLISNIEVILSVILSIVVVGCVILFYNDLFSITYDSEYAIVSGIDTEKYNYVLSILTSVTIVLGIRVVGTMLISSLIIFPTVTALQFSRGFKSVIIFASIISVISVVLGIFLSYVLNLPTGASIVIINGGIFGLGFLYKKII